MKIRIGISLLCFLFAMGNMLAQSKTIQKLIDEERTGHRFYFYPSTLRMLNLKQDPEFNEMIKDLKKLIFFPIRKDRFDDNKFRDAIKELYIEDFEEYMTVDGTGDTQLHVVGKEKPFETVVLAKVDGEYYAADLVGSVDLLKLSRVYQKIAENDEAFSENFLNVFEMMGGDDRKRRSHDQEQDSEAGNSGGEDSDTKIEGEEKKNASEKLKERT